MKSFLSVCLTLLLFLFHIGVVFADQPIVISEFLPNPVGNDEGGEWIELQNITSQDILLDGWTIGDTYGATTSYTLKSDSIRIPAYGYLIFPRSETHIVLNNDTEQIFLTDPLGNTVVSAPYEDVKEGKSFSFIHNSWYETVPTPREENIVSSSPLPTASPTPSGSPSSTSKVYEGVMLSEISACTDVEWIELKNMTNSTLSLEGWMLRDETSLLKLISGNVISSNGYIDISWSQHKLKDTGEVVSLLNPNSVVVDSFSYDRCSEDSSWIFNGLEWGETYTPTRGYENSSMLSTPSSGLVAGLSTMVSQEKDSATRSSSLSKSEGVPSKTLPIPTTQEKEIHSEEREANAPISSLGEKQPTHNEAIRVMGMVLVFFSFGVGVFGWYNVVHVSKKPM